MKLIAIMMFLCLNIVLCNYSMELEQKPQQATVLSEAGFTVWTSDNQSLNVQKAVLRYSPTISSMLDDVGDVQSIHLTMTKNLLSKVIDLIPDLKQDRVEKVTDAINKLDDNWLIAVINAANYLALSDLLDICLKAFAAKLNTIDDIGKFLDADLFPKELASRMLELLGADVFFTYKSALMSPYKIFQNDYDYSSFQRMRFIPASNMLFAIDLNKASIWDATTGARVRFFKVSRENHCMTNSLLAHLNDSGCIAIESILDGHQIRTFFGDSAWLHPFCFLSDTVLVCRGDFYSEKIFLFNIETGACINRTLPKRGELIMSPNGELAGLNPAQPESFDVMSLSLVDKNRYLYDIKAGQVIKKFPCKHNNTRLSCFSPDSAALALMTKENLLVYEVKTGIYRKFKGHTKKIVKAQFNAAGTMVATASEDGTIRVWNFKTGKCLQCFSCIFDGKYHEPHRIFFSCDSSLLAVEFQLPIAAFWNINTGCLIQVLKNLWLRDLSFDGSFFAGSKGKLAYLWAVDKTIRPYLLNQVSISQSLLLLIAFKAIAANTKLSIPADSKMKAAYDSLTHNGIKNLLSSYINIEDKQSADHLANPAKKAKI